MNTHGLTQAQNLVSCLVITDVLIMPIFNYSSGLNVRNFANLTQKPL